MKTKTGFTLNELLGVIAIIAILAAVLFPVFAKAIEGEKAKEAKCISNLKKIGLALNQYSQDYDERFPPGGYTRPDNKVVFWFTAISPYMKNIDPLTCPSSIHFHYNNFSSDTYVYECSNLYDPAGVWKGANHFVSYCLNGYMWGLNKSALNTPSNDFMIWDSVMPDRHSGDNTDPIPWHYGYNQDPEPAGYDRMRTDEPWLGSPHSKGHNYCYADSHVKWLKWMSSGTIAGSWQNPSFYTR